MSVELELLVGLGGRIARAREGRGLLQSELAEAAGVSRSTVQRLEGGASTQLANLVLVLKALGAAHDLEQLCSDGSGEAARRESVDVRQQDGGWRWGGSE